VTISSSVGHASAWTLKPLRARVSVNPRRRALAAAAAWLLIPPLTSPPRTFGDSGEYLLTAESLANHGTPDLRPADLARFAQRGVLEGGMRSWSAYRQGRNGAFYAQHFWAYPALTLPVRAALLLAGVGVHKSFQVTNGLLLLGAVHLVLAASRLEMRWRLIATALLLASPVAWFTLRPHAEVFCVAFTVAALCAWSAGRHGLAVLAASTSAMQCPPLALLAALLWIASATRDRRAGHLLRLAACGLPIALPYAFNLWAFGTPSVIADESVQLARMGGRRAAELLLDPNIGLVRAAPVTLALAIAALVRLTTGGRRRAAVLGLAAVAVGIALTCSGMSNWNHGTSGPSRYALWIYPLLVAIVCVHGNEQRSSLWSTVAWVAVFSQAALFVARGGFAPPPDHLTHSSAAAIVLARWPALYSPSAEIFVERTVHEDRGEAGGDLVLYEAGGACRKALAQKRHAQELLARCGREPAEFTRFRRSVARDGGRDTWTYVDY
jgi:hypothetical protein